MRKSTIMISERNLMFCIAGQLYDQAPARLPRKVDIIMKKVREKIRTDFFNDNEWYTMRIEEDAAYEYIKNLLMTIPEFEELNLSQIEYEKGIDVNDDSRPKYSFTTRYDVETSESWKNDFIDLDAFIRNVYRRVLQIKDVETDCFCCKHKDTELCKECSINEKLKINYECSRKPKGKYTFACKYDCFKSRYICCEECDEKETCNNRCDGNSSICGLKVFD